MLLIWASPKFGRLVKSEKYWHNIGLSMCNNVILSKFQALAKKTIPQYILILKH